MCAAYNAVQNVYQYKPNIISFEDFKNQKDGSDANTKSDNKQSKLAGVSSEVYAFRTKEEIEAMINVLDKHIDEAENDDQRRIAWRNKLMFVLGVNLGIRAGDLRVVRYSFFFHKENDKLIFNDKYVIQPEKTRKQKKFVKLFFNQTVKTIVTKYVEEYPFDSLDDYLFASRKGDKPISVGSIWRIIKNTAAEAGIKQSVGSHSMRKTFGFWMFKNAEDKTAALVMLQQIFNHSSTAVTLRYIGMMDNDMEDAFNSINLGLDFI